MTLDEKVGQLIIVAVVSSPALNETLMQRSPYTMNKEYIDHLICNYHIGGIIVMGINNPEDQQRMISDFQQKTREPLLVLQDLEPGMPRLNPDKVPALPRPLTLGALPDHYNHLIYQVGRELGRRSKAVGCHGILAPVGDLNTNPKNPVIGDRSFGQNPQRVSYKVVELIRGIHDEGVATCAKHYPGHGDTSQDSHYNLPIIDHTKERIDNVELIPFKEAVAANVDMIMLGHLFIPALDKKLPATFSRKIIHDTLINDLKFSGIVITDGLGMKALTDSYDDGAIAVKSLQAGNDLLLCPCNVPIAIQAIKDALCNGTISEKDIDTKVEKMLRLKMKYIASTNQESHYVFDCNNDTLKQLNRDIYRYALTRVGENISYPHNHQEYMVVVSIGKEESFFVNALKESFNVKHLSLPQVATSDQVEALLAQTTDTQQIIIALHGMQRMRANNFGIAITDRDYGYGITSSTISLMQKLKDRHTNISLILFGSPYALTYIQDIADDIIIAYEDTHESQEAAAGIIAGDYQATGSLPVAYH